MNAAADILQGHAMLQHQKKRGGQAEDDQLGDSKLPVDGRSCRHSGVALQAQNEHDQHVKAQQ